MAFHAKLSPSAAKRWMNCPGSVHLIGDESSVAGPEAMRGTAAHKVIETMIIGQQTDASFYRNWQILVEQSTGDVKMYPAGEPIPMDDGWFLFYCDDTMVAGVQMYITEVERVKARLFEAEVFSERFLNMSWLDPRLGGTADTTLVPPDDWLHLFDYKNGRITVEVKDNEQFLNYSVGLLHEHPDAPGVTVHLIQPNAIHEDGAIREESYTADEIKLFEIRMKEAADATDPPNAPLRAGDWCTFCPAKLRCPEFDSKIAEEAMMDFTEEPPKSVPILDPDLSQDAPGADEEYRAGLAQRAKWLPLIDQWARDLRAAIFHEIQNGRPIEGWKIVRGRSNRVWNIVDNDEDGFVAVLAEEAGVEPEALYTRKLKSPAQVEKLSKQAKKVVATLANKPPGKLALARSDDEREAVDQAAAAAEEFADDPIGEP